ncbi:MAG: VCBS repeat-containing protein, partial [Anaerolineae bacterium]|nr:VCBS repeat-containing protein [Anaerolineae bacterium]
MVWGDVDGDGDLDLAAGCREAEGGWAKIYLNVGGTLQTAPAWTSADQAPTTSLAWGDMNRDGYLDLAVGNGALSYPPFTCYQSKVYLNVGGALQTTPIWTAPISECTTSIAWGDMNGDGYLDLAVGNHGDNLNAVYLNVGGMLQTTPTWVAANVERTTSVAWGDMNGDGLLDLAVGNDAISSNKVYLNVGGMLQTTSTWSPGVIEATRSLAWGDVNGDGLLDLAVGNGHLPHSPYTGYPDKVYLNVGGMLQITPTWSSNDIDWTASVAWGDVDGDGDLDLTAGNGCMTDAPYTCYPSKVYLNEGGVLQPAAAWAFSDGYDETQSIAWSDMDGDGSLDLAAGNWSRPNKVYLNVGSTLQTIAAWTSGESDYAGTWSAAWGDMDGDGDLDLATGNGVLDFPPGTLYPNRVYLNVDGMLQPAAAWTASVTETTTGIAWGDVDGDNDLDLAVGNHDTPSKVYSNVGGTLQLTSTWTTSFTINAHCVAWGDVNGDGRLDLAIGGNGIRVYLNGEGTLQSAPVWTAADGFQTLSIAFGDIDGDGDLDLAAGNNGPDKVYLNAGSMLQTPAIWTADDEDRTQSVAWGDMDGDGDLDLAAGNYMEPDKVYLNIGGTLQMTPTWTSRDTYWTYSVAWGDVNGDGDLDLVAGNKQGRSKVFLNIGGVLQTAADNLWTSSEDGGTHGAAWGDVDGDGDLDLALGNIVHNRLYRNSRDGLALPGSIPVVRVARPGPNADLYSSPRIYSNTIPITYTLFDPQGDAVRLVRAWYSPGGGGQWLPAVAATGTVTANLSTTAFFTRTKAVSPNLSIPDLGLITSTLTFTTTDAIADLDVRVNLAHARDSDLVITLTAPFSRSALLVNGRGSSGANFSNTVFDDEAATSVLSGTAPFAGRYRPEWTLARFDGYPLTGTWTLTVADAVGGNVGTLLSWGMTATLNSGKVYTYLWDVAGSGFFGQSDNVVFRIQAVPAIVTGTKNAIPGPYLYSAYAASTFPFRVRGTQVRVMNGSSPAANA